MRHVPGGWTSTRDDPPRQLSLSSPAQVALPPCDSRPSSGLQITLGRKEHDATAFCRTPRIDNADSPMWNHCCALPPLGSTQARIGGTYFIYAWDGDVANEEGDLLGQFRAPRERGNWGDAGRRNLCCRAAPIPPPPPRPFSPLAVPRVPVSRRVRFRCAAGVATLDYASPPGQFLLQLDGGKSHGEATVELTISAQPSPPPPPLAVPPSPPAPPPIHKQVTQALRDCGGGAALAAHSNILGLPWHV